MHKLLLLFAHNDSFVVSDKVKMKSVCIIYSENAKKCKLSLDRILDDSIIYDTYYIVGIDDDNRLTSLNGGEIEMDRNI